MSRYAVIVAALLLLFPRDLFPQQRSLRIKGLKIYTEDQLVDRLNLARYQYGTIDRDRVVTAIESFYRAYGFTLVKVYVMEESLNGITLFVDEGRLGKIVFFNIDDLSTFYLRLRIRLRHRIYNEHVVRESILRLRMERRWKQISFRIKEVKNYDRALIQLDRAMGRARRHLPFFDHYSHRYDLVVLTSNKYMVAIEGDKEGTIITIDDQEQRDAREAFLEDSAPGIAIDKEVLKNISLRKFDYGIRIHYYKGFIPFIRYYQLGLLAPGDFFNIEIQAGIMWGMDRRFSRPPRETYAQLQLMYFLPPSFKELFTPHIQVGALHSRASRPDLALLAYNFLIVNAMVAPGITILKRFNVYTGYGVETLFFYKSFINYLQFMNQSPESILMGPNPVQEVDTLKKRYNLVKSIEMRTDVYNYVEVGVLYDFGKTRAYELRKNRLKKEIAVMFNYYFLKTTYALVRVIGNMDLEFRDRSVYSTKLTYSFAFLNPPFYKESSISGAAFRGFMGRPWFSRNNLALGNEYRFSLYKDFLFLGGYFDMTCFEGSGNDLSGFQFGLVGGPTLRLLMLDQFECHFYYGWDYLASTKKSAGNFYFNIGNKW